jgi:hypothetical protein
MKGFHMTKWLAVSMTAGWHISRPAVSEQRLYTDMPKNQCCFSRPSTGAPRSWIQSPMLGRVQRRVDAKSDFIWRRCYDTQLPR